MVCTTAQSTAQDDGPASTDMGGCVIWGLLNLGRLHVPSDLKSSFGATVEGFFVQEQGRLRMENGLPLRESPGDVSSIERVR